VAARTKKTAAKAQRLKAFGRTLTVKGFWARRVDLFGIPIPVVGITIVVALALIGVTIWGILFSRAPAHITQHIEHRYAVADEQFLRSMGVLLGPPFVPGNRIDTLLNGDQIFPAMLEAIRSAQKTITFESYVYWKGDIGRRFAEALAERARAGVKVHVLLDWEGSNKMDQDSINHMGLAGVQFMKYHRPRWFKYRHLNHRTHRKLLIVDGRIGFTGGVGIADEWKGNAQDKHHWRDTHYRVEGPVVAQLQGAFGDNWTQATGDVLHGDAYFPPLAPVGTLPAQVFMSSVDGGAESLQLMYLLSIAAAKHTIDLSMAYFIPDDHTLDHVVEALKRGVRVRIITPGGETDSWMVRRASRAHWGRILEHGGEVYEYQPTMFHCKVLVVDGLWTSVGSTNFDSRSFRLNDEANLNIYDRGFAQRQIADFENDLKRSRRITYDEWRNRPWYEKVLERTVAFFEPQL
jgi:cardiolipin synthase